MIVAGLTGTFGSGKTTVAEMFADYGAVVIDADKVAHDLLIQAGRCRQAVEAAFPEAVLDGEINRTILAEIVFNHPKKLKQLEGILHPAVKTAMLDQIQELLKGNAPKMVVLEVPLLFEAGFDDIVDAVIVVKSSQRVQIERVAKSRSMKRKEIMLRFYHQMPQSEKLEHADFIIDNRYTKAGTRAQVKQIWDGLVSV